LITDFLSYNHRQTIDTVAVENDQINLYERDANIFDYFHQLIVSKPKKHHCLLFFPLKAFQKYFEDDLI
jgi:hypothetical protein